MPGTSSPTGAYTRTRWPARTSAACTGSAMPYSSWSSSAVGSELALARAHAIAWARLRRLWLAIAGRTSPAWSIRYLRAALEVRVGLGLRARTRATAIPAARGDDLLVIPVSAS